MKEQIEFKVEVEFKGDIEEFKRVAEVLSDLPVKVVVPGWPPGHTTAGCWPIQIDEIVGRKFLEKICKDLPRIIVPKYICRITCGGITDPHLHLRPGEIVLVNRAQFKEVVGKAAQELGERLADGAKYQEVTGAMRNLVKTPR